MKRVRDRKFPVAVALAAAFIASLGLAAAGCDSTAPRGNAGRVVLIGIDGASLRVIGPLLEEGKLPNLAAIARDGVSGPLRSHKPIASPRIWNSMVTGMVPEKHGIGSFSYVDGLGKRRLFESTNRKVPALWNILSEAGFSVGVVAFWNTYPPDIVNGVMVSDHLLITEAEANARLTKSVAPTPGGPVVYPEEWLERLRPLVFEKREPLTPFPNPFAGNTELPTWVKVPELVRRYEEDEVLARIALEVEAQTRPDVLLVLLSGVDRICHYLWGVMEPPELYPPRLQPTDSQRAAGVAAIRQHYEFADALVGRILERYGPDDLVLVVSDHGFEAGKSLLFLTGVHNTDKAINGIVFARGSNVGPAGGEPGPMSVNDVTPTILTWLGLPVAQDMDGHVAPFLQMPEPRQIASYQGTRVEHVTTAPSGVEDNIVEELRKLGYLEE
jgi:predicted AlkP superfamily pyrophosphatase or phosphodiesterase